MIKLHSNFLSGSRGREFIVLFTTPPLESNALERKKNIYVTSENGTKLNITTSPRLDVSLKSQIDRAVHIPSSQRIILPQAIELQSFQKEVKSVLIKTSSDVFIISHDDDKDSVGSTTHIPIYKLSTKYIVISTKPASKYYSQLAVAAIEDNTSISLTFKMKHNLPLKIEGKKFYNGDVFNFSLDRFETYQIEHKADLTGTFIESSAPIAAFSGNDCNELEHIGACDHLVEQLPPTNSMDKTYIVPPNSDDRDTLIRITATENTHFSYMIGGDTQTVFLERLDYFDTHISSSQSCFIESKVPLLVTSIGLGSRNSVTAMGDPSMTIVPGINQYLDYYKIVVPPGYDHNYVSIMINFAFKDLLRINDKTINKRDIVFEENILASSVTYSVRTVRVVEGELTASTVNGERFGLMFAGVTEYEAYGFSGNSLLL